MTTLRLMFAIVFVTVCVLGEVQAQTTSDGLTPPRHG